MFECSECENEFKVITKATDPVSFCPICGAPLLTEDDFDDEDDDDDDEGLFGDEEYFDDDDDD